MFLSWNIYNIQKRKFAGEITEKEAKKNNLKKSKKN